MQDGLISKAQTLKQNWIHTSNQCLGLSKQGVGHYVQSEGMYVKIVMFIGQWVHIVRYRARLLEI